MNYFINFLMHFIRNINFIKKKKTIKKLVIFFISYESFFKIIYKLMSLIYGVRTSFGLDPKTRLGPGPISPNNEFVERGRKK